jgi:hypothetical protein
VLALSSRHAAATTRNRTEGDADGTEDDRHDPTSTDRHPIRTDPRRADR